MKKGRYKGSKFKKGKYKLLLLLFIPSVLIFCFFILNHFIEHQSQKTKHYNNSGIQAVSKHSINEKSEDAVVARNFYNDPKEADGSLGQDVLNPQPSSTKESYNGKEVTQGITPDNFSDKVVDKNVRYHSDHILVKFSKEISDQINNDRVPKVPGVIKRQISKTGFYEVAPAKGESVEKLLEQYNREYPHTVAFVQFDYECMLSEVDVDSGIGTVNSSVECAMQNAGSIEDSGSFERSFEEIKETEIWAQSFEDIGAFKDWLQGIEFEDFKDWAQSIEFFEDFDREDFESFIAGVSYPKAIPSTSPDPETLMWHLKAINIEGAHAHTRGDQSVIIAVLDTGIAYEDHSVPTEELNKVSNTMYRKAPRLAYTHFWKNLNEIPGNLVDDDLNGYVDDYDGFDFCNRDGHPNDDNGHGTHIATTIASASSSEDNTGIARECTIMPIKVLDNNGIGYASTITEAIYYAADHGADVFNMSLAWPPGLNPGPIIEAAISYAESKGIVMVAGSGNNYTSKVCYPAAYNNVICVGGTDYVNKRAPYSNFGNELEIVAPGGNTMVDRNYDGYADGILQLTYQTRYNRLYNIKADSSIFSLAFIQGTSMATAVVSGVVGLMLSLDPTLTVAEARRIMHETARDIAPVGWDHKYGYGLIDAGAIVDQIVGDINEPPADNNDSDGDGFDGLASGGNDCNDNDPTVYPMAPEVAYDGIDQNCDGHDLTDVDGDSYPSTIAGGTDCNDYSPAVHPGAAEIQNDGIDQDCNGYDLIIYEDTEYESSVTQSNECANEGECNDDDCQDEEYECDSCSRDEEVESEC